VRDGDGESASDSGWESDGDAEPGDSGDVVNPGDDDGDAESGDDGDVARLGNDDGDGEPGDDGDDEPDGDAESDDGHVYSGGDEGDGEGSASAIPPLVGWLLGSDAVAAAGEGEP
jgi:hypothetical protein